MIVKLRFGEGGFALGYAESIGAEECPGIESVSVLPADYPCIWTGSVSIHTDGRFSLALSALTGAETRSGLDESDEPWKRLPWEAPAVFSYEPYRRLRALLLGLKTGK